jgi:hypothetical protein
MDGKITSGMRGRTCTSGVEKRRPSTTQFGGVILRRTMDSRTKMRATLLGHLSATVPALAIPLAAVYFLLRMFGPFLLPYYILTGLALSWQWYVMATAQWKELLAKWGVQGDEIEELARRSGLFWPGASSIGLFAMHTAAAEICAVNLGPWLVFHWFGWVLPLTDFSTPTLGTDYYLQHLELVSIVPSLVVGYLMARHYRRRAMSAWILPTIILSYKLWTFTDPHGSVLAPNFWARFSYYFVIVQVMPTFRDFYRSDPVRVAQQMFAVAPFYAGVAYSFGALLAQRGVFHRYAESSIPDEDGSSQAADNAEGQLSERLEPPPSAS